MRRTSALLLGLAIAAQANAAEYAAGSRIDAVTVFPSGAEVTRLAKVRLEPGEHVVVFPDLPAGTVQNSVRVEGKATGDHGVLYEALRERSFNESLLQMIARKRQFHGSAGEVVQRVWSESKSP